jgi:hypothetical protein
VAAAAAQIAHCPALNATVPKTVCAQGRYTMVTWVASTAASKTYVQDAAETRR